MTTRFLPLLLIALMAAPTLAEETQEPSAFRTAYSNYQQALEGPDKRARLKYAKLALETGIDALGENHANIPSLRYNYGYELLEAGQEKLAVKVLAKTLEEYEKKYGKHSTELVTLLIDYGNAKARLHDDSSQRFTFKRAKKILAKAYGKNSLQYANALLKMGAGITTRAKTAGGSGYFKEAKKILAEVAPDSGIYGMAAFYLGKQYLSLNRASRAVPEFEETLRIFDLDEESDNQIELTTRAFLVDALESLGKREEATEHCLAIGRMSPLVSTQKYAPLFQRVPKYPRGMQERGREGQVLVEFAVDKEGIVREGKVVEGVGGEPFEEEALRVIKTWRYAPRFIDGEPVRTEGVQTIITFEMAN